MPAIIATAAVIFVLFATVLVMVLRYKKCPPDRVLVVFGKVGKESSSRCYHGGGAFVWPVVQSFAFLDLTPMPIEIRLEGALSKQNIRVNTPSTFTVGIATDEGVMQNAAERLLGLSLPQIQALAQDIIFGQMRVAIATMGIEEINADRDKLIEIISNGVEVELRKVGLRLINVNVQDITDESGYIEALGQEAAARAINEAKVRVAEQVRDGDIGSAEAQREQRIRVAEADANAVEGENKALEQVAASNATRRSAEAEAERKASAAEKVSSAKAEEEAYVAETEAEKQRAVRDEASQRADIVVPAEIEKMRIETLAEAEAERERRERQGEADGIRAVKEAEASGIQASLDAKAEGFKNIYSATGQNPDFASLLLMIEQLPELVAEQVKAVSNLKIDKVTVWDSGNNEDGKSSTANFLSKMAGSLPPLHEITRQAGVELPEFLGKMSDDLTVQERAAAPTSVEVVESVPEVPEPPAADGVSVGSVDLGEEQG